MTVASTRQAYGSRAHEYIDKLGSMTSTEPRDQETIQRWAGGLSGRIIDVGCGPGHWTSWLHHQGVEAEGVDPVPGFVDDARRRYPNVTFRLGTAQYLDAVGSSVAGILAWYSLVHINPGQIGLAFDEFARVLRPGGGLCVGFFEGPKLAPFDHAITTAYFWPVPLLASVVERAGFAVTASHTRTDPGRRPHAVIVARRAP